MVEEVMMMRKFNPINSYSVPPLAEMFRRAQQRDADLYEQSRDHPNVFTYSAADKPDESEDEADGPGEPVKKKKKSAEPEDVGDDSEDDAPRKKKKKRESDDRDEDETAAAIAETVIKTARMVRGERPLNSFEQAPVQPSRGRAASADLILEAARKRDADPDEEPAPELTGAAELIIRAGQKRRREIPDE
jgi:hypothetical protein